MSRINSLGDFLHHVANVVRMDDETDLTTAHTAIDAFLSSEGITDATNEQALADFKAAAQAAIDNAAANAAAQVTAEAAAQKAAIDQQIKDAVAAALAEAAAANAKLVADAQANAAAAAAAAQANAADPERTRNVARRSTR